MNATTTSSFQPAAGIEVIPGYVLRDKLGAGGFGEVWRADAPGGLAKAIKFVFGLVNDSRAQREMEALQQIKELRHPFLLSTERVEIVQDTLVIVLELAEGNLREYLDDCQRRGLRGLPADELITHLRDAADALDYLWNTQSLQHLDVKPENLMFSGRRVKVGDFGLLKQVGDEFGTLGGVTPAYAAPEVFDGCPAGTSDQYSLAIVYQELLTGQLPFRGRTAAQLAMQHAHHPPGVEPLPIEQRAVVKRALAKQAKDRYPSCRAFVDALIDAQKNRPNFAGRARGDADRRVRQFLERRGLEEPAPTTATQPTPATDRSHTSAGLEQGTQLLPSDSSACEIARPTRERQRVFSSVGLPPFEDTLESHVGHRPAIVIGIGGIGTCAVSHLKRDLIEQLGSDFDSKLYQFLAIDTAEDSIRDAAAGLLGAPLDGAAETLRVPLRPPHEYRDGGVQRFSSMDRRWVYNVPRTLRTERMRPFGRLAFVDHYDRLKRAMDVALHQWRDHRSPANALTPAVFVVGSICGATCSGMANEFGYLVRNRLREFEYNDVDVVGVFTSELPRDEQLADLSAANGMAFLAELEAFSNRLDGYRGEPSAGIPNSGRQISPFDQAMFLHFGADAGVIETPELIQDLGEFLLLNLLAPSGQYFAQSYRADSSSHQFPSRCRTVAHVSLSVGCLVSPEVKGRLIANELIKRWSHYSPQDDELEKQHHLEIEKWTRKSLDRLGAEPKALADWIGEQVLQQQGINQRKMIARATRRAVQQALAMSHKSPGRDMIERMLQEIDLGFGKTFSSPDGNGLTESLSATCEPLLETAVKQLDEWVKTLVGTVGVRYRGAAYAIDFCDDLLRETLRGARDRHAQIQQRIDSCRDSIFTELVLLNNQTQPPSEPDAPEGVEPDDTDTQENPLVRLSQQLEHYAQYRFHQWCVKAAERMLTLMLDRTVPVRLWLEQLNEKLIRLENKLTIRTSAGAGRRPTDDENPLAGIADDLAQHLEQLIHKLDEAVALRENAGCFSLVGLADMEGAELETAEQSMAFEALRVIESLETELAAAGAGREQATQSESLNSIETAMHRIAPPASHRGENHRVMVLTPDASHATHLQEQVAELAGTRPTILAHPALNVEFVAESLQVDPAHLAMALYANQERRLELAERLRTRIDL